MSVLTTLTLSNKQDDFETLKPLYDSVLDKYIPNTTCTYTEFSTFQYEQVPDPADATKTIWEESVSTAYKYDIYRIVFP